VVAYVCCSELLLCAEDCSAPLCCVQCALAFDRRLSLRGACASHFAADLRYGFPVVAHVGGVSVVMFESRFDKK